VHADGHIAGRQIGQLQLLDPGALFVDAECGEGLHGCGVILTLR
jgi:hypothetical protein